jgi:NADH dehydrogenase (ubiquinone) 1 alpha subcomplex subunit 5
MFRYSLCRLSATLFINNKISTGVTGVSVVPNARSVLLDIYQQTLIALRTHNVPEDSEYSKAVENVTRYRMGIVDAATDAKDVENSIQCGTVEELIEQARSEMDLIAVMAHAKPWEKQV